MTSRLHRVICPLIAVGALALASCTSTARPATPTNAPPFASPSPSTAPSEGPVSTPVHYPNGLTVRIVKVEHGNRAYAYGLTPDLEPIKVTVQATNNGTVPFRLIHTWLWTVLYGPNRGEAAPVADAEGDTGRVSSDNPEQVGVGQTVALFATAAVPRDQLGILAVRVDLDPSEQTATEYTFTGVEALLR